MIAPDLAALAVACSSLQLLSGNPRRGDVGAVARSLERFGQRKPIVARRSDRVVVAGNHTLLAARELGWDEVAAVWVDDDEATARAFALADNRTAELGGYDDEALAEMIGQVHTANPELLAATGWTADDLVELLAKTAQPMEGLTDPDEVPEPPAEAITKPGDLWLLGEHRLLCGDCTLPDHVERVLEGGKPTLLLTDPPYGVELDMEWRDRAGHNQLAPAERSYMKRAMDGKGISGDTIGDWSHAFVLVPSLTVAYVWHATSHLIEVGTGLQNIGFELRQQIIWVKTVAAMSRSAYHWKHEPCWYAVRKGATASWIGSRDQVTLWEAASPKHIMSGSKETKYDHPTQKPIVLYEIPLGNHSGDVYEPFGGSGTAIIAAQRLGRRAYAVEVEPRFCDVICRRFQEFTGTKPILEATGEEHDFGTSAGKVAQTA